MNLRLMSTKYRKFPPTGTVTSVRIEKDLYAYVVIFRNCYFWLYGFLTEKRVCDPALFPTSKWKKHFRSPSAGMAAGTIDECLIELSNEEQVIPPTWEKCFDWEVERKEVPTPYRVTTDDYREFYVTEEELPNYQENVAFTHKDLVAYVKANLDQFEVVTPREDQLSSPVEALPEVATFTPGCIYEIWLSGLERMELTDVEEIGEEIDDELQEHEAGEVIGTGGTDEDNHNIAVQCEPGMNKKALGCIRRVLKRLKANPETTDIWVQGESEKNLGLK
jgi:hypothetical protein